MVSAPTTLWSGTTGPKGDTPGPDSLFTRAGMYLIAVVLFPVALLFYSMWVGLFTYARMPWWVPTPFALLGWTITTLFTGGPFAAVSGHVNAWLGIVKSVNYAGGFTAWLSDNALQWILGQMWFGFLAGTTFAAVVAGWKWIRRPKWEHRNLRPGPVLARRFKKTKNAIATGVDSPADGITVGVAADLRDPRFAGGKPGAPYGTRVVLKDGEVAGHCLVVGGSGAGKALDVTTPIPTADGRYIAMGDLQVGDVVLDEFMNPTTVIGAYDTMFGHECYEVLFSDGSRLVADRDHLWRVRDQYADTGWMVVSTEQLKGLSLDTGVHQRLRFVVPAVTDRAGEIARPERAFVRIRPVVTRAVRCIAVDSPNHVFLAGEGFVPTHNTTTMLLGMRDVIRRGHGLIVVDCKGGPDVPEQLAEWAARYGREFYHWSMFDSRQPYDGPADGPAYYDPISRGDPSRRKDLIIGSQRWDVEYYKTVIEDYLQTLFAVAALVPPPAGVDTVQDVADLLSPEALIRRAAAIPRDRYPELMSAVEHVGLMGETERSGIANMRARLNTLRQSIAGPWLRHDPEGLRDIDLLQAADEGHVVVFSLDSSNYEETSARLAGLIVQDLKTVSSALREQPAATPTHVYIDEFSAVDATNIYGLLAKARDARMPVTLATQALADLKRREAHFDSQVVGIVGSFLIHRANSEDDSKVYAGLSGLTRKMVHRMGVEGSTGVAGTLGAASATGAGFLQEEEDYRVPAGVFQSLRQGQCVFIAKIPEDRYVAPVHVIPERPLEAERLGDPAIDHIRSTRRYASHENYETFEAVVYQPIADVPVMSDPSNVPPLTPPVPEFPAPADGQVPPQTGPVRPGPARPGVPGARPAGAPLPGMPGGLPVGEPGSAPMRPSQGQRPAYDDEWGTF